MKKSFWSKLAIGLSSLALLAGCSSNSGSDTNQSQSQNASKTIETLKIAFVPSRDPETIVTTTEPLKELLKKELAKEGYDVKNVDISVGTSFDAVGEALASGSADIGFLPGGTYVLYDKEVDVLLTATRDNLLKTRGNDNVVVIDARGSMLEEGALIYDKATVVDWTDISLLGEFGGEDLGKLLSKDNYQEIFNILGIKENTEVLVYGFTMPNQGFGDEARVVYTFNYAGFDNIKIIDGGFDKVEQLGFNKNYNPENDRINVSNIVREEAQDNEKAIFTDELLSFVNSADVQIIDTRLEAEYNGRVIYGENKAGHIPGAISIPFNSLVDEDGFIKSREALEEYFVSKGLDKNKLQITYCTTGVRASYVAVILEELGYKVRNYEPSFARYANVGEVE